MAKYEAYPKWKFAKPASEIDKPRSVMVANAAQEAELGDEWYDTANYTNNTREETKAAVDSNIPAGYVPQPYPKWKYAASVPGGRLVHNRGEEDALEDSFPGVEWSDRADFTSDGSQMKTFGLPEDTGLDPNDPLNASDPVRLHQDGADEAAAAAVERSRTQPEGDTTDNNTVEASDEEVPVGTAKKAVLTNKAKAKAAGEAKAAKADDDLL